MTSMTIWQQMYAKRRMISWLMVVALIAVVLLPTHVHLHHETDSYSITSHEHKVDLHVFSSQIDQAHHEDATVIDTVSDMLIKQFDDNPLAPFILFAILMILTFTRLVTRFRIFNHLNFSQFFYHINPPLRAPPIL